MQLSTASTCPGAATVQLPVVSACQEAATFGQLFHWLLSERQLLAIGLVRTAYCQGRRLRYVYTVPQHDTELRRDDAIIALCRVRGGQARQLPLDALCCTPSHGGGACAGGDSSSGGGAGVQVGARAHAGVAARFGRGAGAAAGVWGASAEGAGICGGAQRSKQRAAAQLPMEFEDEGGVSGRGGDGGLVGEGGERGEAVLRPGVVGWQRAREAWRRRGGREQLR